MLLVPAVCALAVPWWLAMQACGRLIRLLTQQALPCCTWCFPIFISKRQVVRHFEQFFSMFHVLASWLLVVHVGLAGKAALLCAGRSVVVPG